MAGVGSPPCRQRQPAALFTPARRRACARAAAGENGTAFSCPGMGSSDGPVRHPETCCRRACRCTGALAYGHLEARVALLSHLRPSCRRPGKYLCSAGHEDTRSSSARTSVGAPGAHRHALTSSSALPPPSVSYLGGLGLCAERHSTPHGGADALLPHSLFPGAGAAARPLSSRKFGMLPYQPGASPPLGPYSCVRG